MKFNQDNSLEKVVEFLLQRDIHFNIEPLPCMKRIKFSLRKNGGCIGTSTTSSLNESIVEAMNHVNWNDYPET